METQNGMDYAQNYDLIIKWMAEALRGETLEVLGVETGRIEEVFAFEPVDIPVRAGRVDVMARDETGALYHIEEQRNLSRADMCRFAAYHFLGARQWGIRITDVILASGKVYAGKKMVLTDSGMYAPLVIDFSQRDGRKRLREIREAVRAGTFDSWTELVFLPLCGREAGAARGEMAEAVLRFESELYKADRISAGLLVATLIMSNKLIDKDRLRQIWEEVKMLDILEIAREEGMKEGKVLGVREGKVLGVQEGKVLGVREGKVLGVQEGKALGMEEAMRDMITDLLTDRFRVVSPRISEQLRDIRNRDTLKGLCRQSAKCQNLQEFEDILSQIM